jgi:hypothetical protein
MNNDLTFTSVDTLGQLLAQIADLTKQADAIKDQIKDGGKTVEGVLFKATYIEANRKVTDWKAIAKAYNIPDEVIIDNTTVTAVFSVKVTSR